MHRPEHAPARPTNWSRALWFSLVGVVFLGAAGLADPDRASAGTPSHAEQVRFMWAMARAESGSDYYARNATSGAFGRYQIMPFNWPVWAADYLGDRRAEQTPYNQEKVAYGKIRDLYGWLGTWKRVAYWWLTGRTDHHEKRWTAYARGYVTKIMRMRKQAPARGSVMPPRTSSRASRGDWRRAGGNLRLRMGPAAKAWPRKGRIRDGQVLKVHSSRQTHAGDRWIEVVTADGRLGWLSQPSTVPARKPKQPSRWADVRQHGSTSDRADRTMVRPRPR